MSYDCMITQRLLAAQRTMFRLADKQHGFSQKVLHLETGMSLSALGQYARGETAMSGPAILKLSSVKEFPADLLSLLYEGTGRHVSDDNEGGAEPDFDALGQDAIDLGATVAQARSPHSPGGTNIVPIEKSAIKAKARKVAAKAGSIAA